MKSRKTMKDETKRLRFQIPLMTACHNVEIERAIACGADALFIEAWSPALKNTEKIAKILAQKTQDGPLCFFFASPENSQAHFSTLLQLGADGVIIKTPEGPCSVMKVGAKLAVCEIENRRPRKRTLIIAQTPEDARSALELGAYANGSIPLRRLAGLLWSPERLKSALDVAEKNHVSLDVAKGSFLLAAAAAQVQPIDSASLGTKNSTVMKDVEKSRKEGFSAKILKKRRHVRAIKKLFDV